MFFLSLFSKAAAVTAQPHWPNPLVALVNLPPPPGLISGCVNNLVQNLTWMEIVPSEVAVVRPPTELTPTPSLSPSPRLSLSLSFSLSLSQSLVWCLGGVYSCDPFITATQSTCKGVVHGDPIWTKSLHRKHKIFNKFQVKVWQQNLDFQMFSLGSFAVTMVFCGSL